ncbi:MAG TPA: ribosome recycling factor [Candidatus Dormibacteraeota bacterium]|nr:ribosome recycling factor [Candidatus Dormibacteraeota bacterium]
MIDDWLKDAEQRMEKSLEALHKDLATIRTGRATPALVDRLQVEYYGTMTPLQSLANITAPEARLLVIQPYDRNAMGSIEKAIQKSELGLNPSNDGTLIRIPIPQLTEERRKEFVKMAKQKAEAARVAIRNIRRDEVEHIRRIEKEGEVGTDDVDRGLGSLQKITDRFVAQVDEIAHKKEQEILEV